VADCSWRQIVSVYSECLLTNERDKLVAIGGIAKQFAQRQNLGQYLAGLWSNDLVTQLTWKSWNPSKSSRPSQHRAPTWSWASLGGAIYLDYHSTKHMTPMVELGEVRMKCLDDDPYGEVVAAKLKLTGHLSSFTFDHTVPRDKSSIACSRKHCIGIERLDGQMTFSCREIQLVFDVAIPELQLPTNLFFLPLGQPDFSSVSEYDGLILEAGDAPGIFKRCGFLNVRDKTASLFDVSGNPQTSSSELLSDSELFNGGVRTIYTL
jgi:hypothetical protein